MKIAALVTQPHGGPVDHAVDVACELARRGHDSHIIGPVGDYANRLQSAGVHCHEMSIATKTDLRGTRRLQVLLRSLRPDVLHCQDRRAGLVGRFLRRSAGRTVYTMHGVPDGLSDLVAGNARVARRTVRDVILYIYVERWLDRLMPTEVIVPCAALVPYVVREVGIRADHVRVVPNGIDPARFASDGSQRGGKTILWVGVMAPVKRIDRLVRALTQVPEARLVLVGDGAERSAIESLVAELGLAERVEFRGFLSDPTPVFAEADVFALPSGAEACPLALLQAMSCGLPVVASRVGGIPDVVRDEVDGLLVDADDVDGLAAGLRKLIDDAGYRAAMGASARERIVTSYSLSRCVDLLLEAYAA